jgi:nucleotide-binding universal stress UspA family protein
MCQAVSLARAYKAKLFICHCVRSPILPNLLNRGAPNGGVRKELTEWLERNIGLSDASQPRWKVIVVENAKDCGEEIVRTAREQRIDLIVMSRRSRAALLGSTTEQVSRTASCPVLIVHQKESEEDINSNKSEGFKRVLISHDFSSSSELALSYAISIAQKFKSELHLMHVLPQPEEDEPEIALPPVGAETAYQRAARRLLDSVPQEVYQNCTVTHIVRRGKPYREVLAYVREQDIDLACMGALGSDFGLEALFGSNVDRVVRQASCSVLIARPLKPAVTDHLDVGISRPNLRRTFSHGG